MSGTAFMTPHEISAETGLSYDAVRRAIASGELKATRIRRRILVRRDWFDAWIEAHVMAPAARIVVPNRLTPIGDMSASAPGSRGRLLAIERGEL